MTSRNRLQSRLPAALLACALVAGCRLDMHDAPRYDPLEESDFFRDRRASRPLVEGTIARGFLRDNDVFYTGMQGGSPVDRIPIAVTRETIARGQSRFNVYCSPCHGRTGEGTGMIVQRGYKQPTSLHDPRLRNERAGYFFDVMTRGFGQMPDYAAQIAPADRWAVVSYIRALQLSQNANAADLSPEDRSKLDAGQSGRSHTPEEGAEGAPKHD
jgi:mono/diheme cytochrome c family protein